MISTSVMGEEDLRRRRKSTGFDGGRRMNRWSKERGNRSVRVRKGCLLERLLIIWGPFVSMIKFRFCSEVMVCMVICMMVHGGVHDGAW